MTYSPKALILALTFALALSAIVSTTASAQALFTSDGPFTLKGTETGAEKSNALTAFGFRTECPGSTFTGHRYNTTPHSLIFSGETTATLTPHYVNCKSSVGGLGFPTTIDMNGCDYVAHLGAVFSVDIDIVCPAGKEITVTMWTTSVNHSSATTPMCILHVKPQITLSTLVRTNTANDIGISGTLKNVLVQKTSTTHSLLCPSASTAAGEFDIDVTVKGFNAEGSETAISIT